jgi:hypothetical protein
MWVRFPSPAPEKQCRAKTGLILNLSPEDGKGQRNFKMHAGPHGSVVEHFLGKEEVTGSIPVVGSRSCFLKENRVHRREEV